MGTPACQAQLTEQRPKLRGLTLKVKLPREVTAVRPCQSTEDFRSSEMSGKVLKKKRKKRKREWLVLLWKGKGVGLVKLRGGRGEPRTSYHTTLYSFITFKRVEEIIVSIFSISQDCFKIS